MKRFLTKTASTQRSPGISNGKRGAPIDYLSGIACTPIDPVSSSARDQLITRLGLDTPVELRQTFVAMSVDIARGDMLIVDGIEYPVRLVQVWDWRNTTYQHVYLELLPQPITSPSPGLTQILAMMRFGAHLSGVYAVNADAYATGLTAILTEAGEPILTENGIPIYVENN